MIILKTRRLVFRELALQDVDALCRILADRETMKYYPRPYTKEETKAWIEKSLKSYEENGYGLWAIDLKTNGLFIGQCGISNQNIDGITVPEIGYHIDKNHWNNGYATEAASACLEYGFGKLGLDEIFIHTYIRNLPSIRIAEKIGMTKRKEYDKLIPDSGTVRKHVVYSLSARKK